MKNLISIVFIALYFVNSGYAQNTNKKVKEYKAWITTGTIPTKSVGLLYEVKDSSVVLLNSVASRDYTEELFKKT